MKETQAIALLKKHSPDERTFRIVLRHSRAVQKYALLLAKKIKRHHKVDLEFIETAALLHDIGRFTYPPWRHSARHGIEGARILRKEKIPERYARVCERHLGAGINKADIKKEKLDLPSRDYMPKTIEEKIICYADKRISMAKEILLSKAIERFSTEVSPEYGQRVKRLHLEIQKLYKPKKKKKK
ncbi:MAG: HD domain-containing protein [Nanoarchaeota archaeon]|nr:HD domain-containing protein [Nanoarchaeota archaeon]